MNREYKYTILAVERGKVTKINFVENKEMSGAYIIICITNNKKYVGGVKTGFNGRFIRHFRHLIQNDHPNHYLQEDFNTYGINNFTFEILECGVGDFVDRLEAKYIQQFSSNDREKGYNIKNVKYYKFKEIMADSLIKLMSHNKKIKALAVDGLNNAERGLNKALKLYDLHGMFLDTYHSAKELCDKMGFSRHTLCHALRKRKLAYNNYIIIYANDILTEEDLQNVKKTINYAKQSIKI